MRRVVIASVAAGIGAFATASAHGETLEEALASTYNTNPQILSERANLRAIDEGVPQALAGWRPTVTFSGSGGAGRAENTPGAPPNAPGHQSLQPHSYSLTVNQPLFNGGNTVAKTSQDEDTGQSELARLIATESTVLFSAAQSYFDVLRDQAVIEIDKNNVQVLTR